MRVHLPAPPCISCLITVLVAGDTDMAALFKKFVFYHNKMLPYQAATSVRVRVQGLCRLGPGSRCLYQHALLQVLSLTEEARKDTCVPVLQARNYVLVSTQKRLTAALDKLCVYVQLACPTGS